MIAITVAMGKEAMPIVNKLRLKQTQTTPFRIWENDDIFLIATGMGKVAAASGASYLWGQKKNVIHAMLNVGIAGHCKHDVGEVFLAHKIIEKNTNQSIYPSICFSWPYKTDLFYTVDEMESSYSKKGCYEMESFGFFQAACRFLPIELVHSLKVVSDNPQANFDKTIVHDLMGKNLKPLLFLIDQVKKLSSEMEEKKMDLKPFFNKWHFTQTQKHQLTQLSDRLIALGEKELDLSSFSSCKDASSVIQKLTKHLQGILNTKYFR